MEYSQARVEIIRIRRSWFLWSIPISCVFGAAIPQFMGAAKGSAVGVMVGLVGLAALIWPFYCLFKLSTAIEPRRGVAWSMLALQLVPVVGLVAVVSLVLKAGKIISGAAQVAEQSRS